MTSSAQPCSAGDPVAELRRLYYFAREVMRKNHEESTLMGPVSLLCLPL